MHKIALNRPHVHVPIILVDGESIVDLMIEKGFGVQIETMLIPSYALDLVLGNDDSLHRVNRIQLFLQQTNSDFGKCQANKLGKIGGAIGSREIRNPPVKVQAEIMCERLFLLRYRILLGTNQQ